MTKFQNPFYTITESVAILKSIGADPLCNLSEDQVDWRECILSVVTQATYENSSHYHTCEVHLTNEGFDELRKQIPIDYPVTVTAHLAGYEMHSIEPSPMLRLFKLVLKESVE